MAVPLSGACQDHPVRLGIVGLGKMGLLHFKTWRRLGDVTISAVVDKDARLAPWAQALGVPFFCRIEDALGHMDAAVIATPVDQHVSNALSLLATGIHCLIEKPIAFDQVQAQQIVAMARLHGAVLAVGHSERFNPALQHGFDTSAGCPKALEVFRMAPARQVRNADVDVVLDLMVHDLDWLLNLPGQTTSGVKVQEARWTQGLLSHVRCEIGFLDRMQVVLTASHLAAHRHRELILHGADGGVRRVNLDAARADHHPDPLTQQAAAFLLAIQGRPSSVASGEQALRVMALVDQIRRQCGQTHAPEYHACVT